MPSERLQRAIGTGSATALFSVLNDWPTPELQALLKDADDFITESHAAIDKAWQKTAMLPEVFFNHKNSMFIDHYRDETKQSVVLTMSEICSVAIYYLE